MGFFEDLFKKDHVKNHPLLSGYKNAHKVREAVDKHAQEVEEDDLMDEFSQQNMRNPKGPNPTDKAPQDVIASAFNSVRDMVGQFEWPITPKISFNNFKDVKKAVNDEHRIVSGIVIFNMDLKTKTGVRVQATIPVTISRGQAIPPSTFNHNGSTYIFAQSAINDIVKSKTVYKLDQMRDMYSAPFMKEDRQQAVESRNRAGWQPVEHDTRRQRQIRMSRFKGIPVAYEAVKKEMDKALEEGTASFPQQYVNVLQNFVLNHVNVAEYDQWYPALVNDGYVLNQYGKGVNRGRCVKAQMVDIHQEATYVQMSIDEAKIDLHYAKKEGRFDEAAEIEDEIRQMEAYLLSLSMGGGHEIQAQMEEAEEYDLLTEDSDEDVGGVAEVNEFGSYNNTKTPIEPGDAIKFLGNEGMIRGNVIEVQDPYLIVKSKGVEYRVMAEDVQPLPKTFRKMYAALSENDLFNDSGFTYEREFKWNTFSEGEDITVWVKILNDVFKLEPHLDFEAWEEEWNSSSILAWDGPSEEEIVALIEKMLNAEEDDVL